MPRKVQRRGPKRAHGSKPKLRCGWARCRRKTDVKNKPHILKIELVNLKATRKLHGSCGTVRFCSAACLSKCQLKQEALTTRGGREALTPEQCCMLFEVFVSEVQAPWAAVAFLLGIFMGERQGCVLQVRDNWFRGLSTPNPSITVPRVNKKTKPREIPLFHDFASLLLKWANPDSGPLRGGGGQPVAVPRPETADGRRACKSARQSRRQSSISRQASGRSLRKELQKARDCTRVAWKI